MAAHAFCYTVSRENKKKEFSINFSEQISIALRVGKV
jgi:hypothetical protein